MNKKFVIEFPEIKETEAELDLRIKRLLKENFDNCGSLAKIFVVLYSNGPCTATELTHALRNYYRSDYERTNVSRYLRRLEELNLIASIPISHVLSTPDDEMSDMYREIVKKYFAFLSKIPAHFKNNFTNVNYWWVDDFGEKYTQWCCEILKYKLHPK